MGSNNCAARSTARRSTDESDLGDPDAPFTVTADALYYRHPISPYVGAALRGRVHRTFVRGHEVYDGDGHPAGPIGRALLHREAA